jgi:hypothetical protein
VNSLGALLGGDFEWPVAPGHDWKDWLDDNGNAVIVPATWLETPPAVEEATNRTAREQRQTGPVLCPHGSTVKTYHPMQREHAGLFRTFAEVDYRDRDAVRAFANAYGLLGIPRQYQHILASRTRPEHSVVGESHLAWALEICFMKEAIQTAIPDERRTLNGREEDRLRWLFNRQLQYVQARNTDWTGQPRFSIGPLTLLAAMWLQFSEALTGEKRYISCKCCGRFLEISTADSGYRSHRAFCNDVCKTRDYRRRKRTALTLAKRGSTLAAIAERTTTDRATVRKWLAASKKR